MAQKMDETFSLKSKNVGEVMQEISKRHTLEIEKAKKQAILLQQKLLKAKVESLQVEDDFQTEFLGTPIPTQEDFAQCEIIDKSELLKEAVEKSQKDKDSKPVKKKRAVVSLHLESH